MLRQVSAPNKSMCNCKLAVEAICWKSLTHVLSATASTHVSTCDSTPCALMGQAGARPSMANILTMSTLTVAEHVSCCAYRAETKVAMRRHATFKQHATRPKLEASLPAKPPNQHHFANSPPIPIQPHPVHVAIAM